MQQRKVQAMRQAKTLTGKPFSYEGALQTELKVHTKGSIVDISSEVITFVMGELMRAEETAMGASRDDPIPGSLGDKLKSEMGRSPQVLSYLIPLLQEVGFCTAVKQGRAFVIRRPMRQRSRGR